MLDRKFKFGWMFGRKVRRQDGRTDRRKDGRRDEQTKGRTVGRNVLVCCCADISNDLAHGARVQIIAKMTRLNMRYAALSEALNRGVTQTPLLLYKTVFWGRPKFESLFHDYSTARSRFSNYSASNYLLRRLERWMAENQSFIFSNYVLIPDTICLINENLSWVSKRSKLIPRKYIMNCFDTQQLYSKTRRFR